MRPISGTHFGAGPTNRPVSSSSFRLDTKPTDSCNSGAGDALGLTESNRLASVWNLHLYAETGEAVLKQRESVKKSLGDCASPPPETGIEKLAEGGATWK